MKKSNVEQGVQEEVRHDDDLVARAGRARTNTFMF